MADATASPIAVLVPLCQGELPLITHAMVTGARGGGLREGLREGQAPVGDGVVKNR